jgi:hypothetical protein
VATRRFDRGRPFGRLTTSVGGIYAHERDGIRAEDADVYCGLELGLTPRLSLVGEWRERTAGLPSAGLGAMVVYGAPGYAIGVGVLNNGNSDRQGFFIGAGFNVNTFD